MKVVISLGGSLIYPDGIDEQFILYFRDLIQEYVQNSFEFIIICGGGKLARNMQQEARDATDEQKDWLGIDATKQNAETVRKLFNKELVNEQIITNPHDKLPNKKIILCSGWKPGFSTDYDAIVLAQLINADLVINMSNIDYVYDKDPKSNPNAKKLTQISWSDFRKLVGDEWSPGLNMPFDPIASKQAQKNNQKVIIIGNNLYNLRDVLDNKKFEGTIIE